MIGEPVSVLIAAVIGYLLGSIPFGLLLSRMFGLGDVRNIGSGNIGATNVLRTGNKPVAAATLLLDGLKGTAAVLLGSYFGAEGALAAGYGAFTGHCFPVWLKFKGGKGVATYIGILGGVAWIYALAFMGIWLIVAIVTRYSSLSALVATGMTPIMIWGYGGSVGAIIMSAVLAAICWWNHRANISRLRSGEESKIGQEA
ncbi:MAG: glycerol-3-phosphate 1-O-acyltransferase PlsY [Pseudomonadota bacterium]